MFCNFSIVEFEVQYVIKPMTCKITAYHLVTTLCIHCTKIMVLKIDNDRYTV